MSVTPPESPVAPRGATLSTLDASLIVVGSIVGAGIFLVGGMVAQQAHSPAVFLGAWLVGGLVALAGALSNGELGGLYPRSGGEYVYLREAYGPAVGFLSGWTSFWIAFPGSIASLGAGLGVTVAGIFGWQGAWSPVLIGGAAIVTLTAVNALGLRPGTWTQNTLSGAKLAAFAGMLALGALVHPEGPGGLTPLLPPGDTAHGAASALVPIFFAYSGWNAATYVTGEMRDPTRSLGRALALGTILCVMLYVAVNAVLLRAMPLGTLAGSREPVRLAASLLGGPAVAALISPLVALCVLSSMQASVLVGPRIYRAMATDGLFFAPLARLHPKTGVPVVALVAQAGVSLVLLVSGRFEQLLTFATFGMLAFSTLTVAAVVVLRVRLPDAPRRFRVPGYPWVPLLFVVTNGWVMWNVLAGGTREALVGLAIIGAGIVAYAAFRARLRPQESAS